MDAYELFGTRKIVATRSGVVGDVERRGDPAAAFVHGDVSAREAIVQGGA